GGSDRLRRLDRFGVRAGCAAPGPPQARGEGRGTALHTAGRGRLRSGRSEPLVRPVVRRTRAGGRRGPCRVLHGVRALGRFCGPAVRGLRRARTEKGSGSFFSSFFLTHPVRTPTFFDTPPPLPS